jgi:hypothetical protein
MVKLSKASVLPVRADCRTTREFSDPLLFSGTLRVADHLHHASRQVVHGADDPDGSLLCQFVQNRTPPPDVLDPEDDVRPRHGVDESQRFGSSPRLTSGPGSGLRLS